MSFSRDKNLVTLVPDLAADIKPVRNARTAVQHVRDLGHTITYLRNGVTHVTLVGTSGAALSVANAATRLTDPCRISRIFPEFGSRSCSSRTGMTTAPTVDPHRRMSSGARSSVCRQFACKHVGLARKADFAGSRYRALAARAMWNHSQGDVDGDWTSVMRPSQLAPGARDVSIGCIGGKAEGSHLVVKDGPQATKSSIRRGSPRFAYIRGGEYRSTKQQPARSTCLPRRGIHLVLNERRAFWVARPEP